MSVRRGWPRVVESVGGPGRLSERVLREVKSRLGRLALICGCLVVGVTSSAPPQGYRAVYVGPTAYYHYYGIYYQYDPVERVYVVTEAPAPAPVGVGRGARSGQRQRRECFPV